MKSRARQLLVVCGSHAGHGEAVVEELVGFGYDARHCIDEESLMEAAFTLRPRAIVYELHHQLSVDLAILALVRRVLPRVPLIVVAGAMAEQAVQALCAVNPTVLTHDPVDRSELLDAVRLALRRSGMLERREHAAVGA